MMIPFGHALAFAGALFVLGLSCVLIRRQILMILIGVEIMLNAANLAFIGFSRVHDQPDGQIYAFFVMTLAAAEAAVGLAIVIALFRLRESTDVDELNLMKW